jgi:hypothetical protein
VLLERSGRVENGVVVHIEGIDGVWHVRVAAGVEWVLRSTWMLVQDIIRYTGIDFCPSRVCRYGCRRYLRGKFSRPLSSLVDGVSAFGPDRAFAAEFPYPLTLLSSTLVLRTRLST